MISYLRGTLLQVEENRILLDVQGVGYEVAVTSGFLQQLPAQGEEVEVYTHLQVREDAWQLFGFPSAQDRSIFRLLLKTQGVGPRVALTILDTFRSGELAEIIAKGDAASLMRVPGVGRKSAERLLLELKDKLPSPQGEPARARKNAPPDLEEAAQALLSLGYGRREAEAVLKKVIREKPVLSAAGDILREALKALGKGKKG